MTIWLKKAPPANRGRWQVQFRPTDKSPLAFSLTLLSDRDVTAGGWVDVDAKLAIVALEQDMPVRLVESARGR